MLGSLIQGFGNSFANTIQTALGAVANPIGTIFGDGSGGGLSGMGSMDGMDGSSGVGSAGAGVGGAIDMLMKMVEGDGGASSGMEF